MIKKNPTQTELNELIQKINSGDFADAETLASGLSKTYPKAILVWKILGVAIAEQGKILESIEPMKKVVLLDSKDAEAHRNLGTALKELGQVRTAEAHLQKSIQLNPNDTLAYVSLAKILNDQKKFSEAEKLCRKAITFKYDIAEAHDQLGIAMLRQQKLAEAESSLKTAIMIDPTMADAHNNLGIVQNELGKFDEASQSYTQAIQLNPIFANAYSNLANNFSSQNQPLEAETAYRKAIELNPQHNLGLSNLGALLHNQGRQEEAKKTLEQALEINPQWPPTLNNLGNVYKDLGEVETAIAYYRKAITAEPAMTMAYSNLLLIAGYHAKTPPEQALQEAKRFGEYVSAQAKNKYKSWLCQLPCDNENTKMRIGFVSGDLRRHAVTFFLEGLLRNLDKQKFELIAYPTQPKEDDITALIKPHFAKWQSIYNLSDKDAAEIIHKDALHILFDLSGHTAFNRLEVFAYKPAPIQVTWIGYPATTGMTEMDYILGDQYLVPFGKEGQFVETVWRFPEVTGCFTPLTDNIPVTECLPAIRNGYITFGCFNNLIKMNDDVITTWSQILHAVPTAKLHLQAQQLSEPSVLQQTYNRYAEHGIAPERLILEGKTPRLDYFHSYNKIDIALDPFPCPGGTTTADTLWMSVPVLTMKGKDYWSRIGESLAHNVGQTDWIAEDSADYIRKAVTFSTDKNQLLRLRKELRNRVIASPLFDAHKFALHFENAVRGMIKIHEEKLSL